jgi:hypothetical protein
LKTPLWASRKIQKKEPNNIKKLFKQGLFELLKSNNKRTQTELEIIVNKRAVALENLIEKQNKRCLKYQMKSVEPRGYPKNNNEPRLIDAKSLLKPSLVIPTLTINTILKTIKTISLLFCKINWILVLGLQFCFTVRENQRQARSWWLHS